MDVGMMLPASGSLASPEALAQAAALAELHGFDSVWVSDHVAMPVENDSSYPYADDGRMTWEPGMPWLDPILALTWAAAATSTVRLGTSVLVLPLRPALLVAKQVATLDLLSQGRVVLGVGSGWLAEEFSLLEQSFSDRGARMDEMMDLLRVCWSGQPVSFEGTHHRFPPFMVVPAPPQGAALPLLVGGHSERALRRAAERGDGWHPNALTPEEVASGRRRLSELLDAAGRTIDDVRVVVKVPKGPAPTVDLMHAYADAGVDELVLVVDYRGLSWEQSLEQIDSLGQLVPAA